MSDQIIGSKKYNVERPGQLFINVVHWVLYRTYHDEKQPVPVCSDAAGIQPSASRNFGSGSMQSTAQKPAGKMKVSISALRHQSLCHHIVSVKPSVRIEPASVYIL